eukprot:c2360_g1_i1 orf=196-1287(+)
MDAAGGVPNWSSTLEDLLDEGKTQEAQQLLEGLVGELQARADAPTNLTLAAALSDLSSLYHSLGLSSQALSASSSALLIKQTAQSLPPSRTSASSFSNCDHKLRETASAAPSVDCQQIHEGLKSGSNCEEEWETLLCEGLVKLDGLSPAKGAPDIVPHEKNAYKQRGRGAFTYGEKGMYIDRLTASPIKGREHLDMTTEDVDSEDTTTASTHSKVACGVRHVLVVSFPPSVTTKDLEELFEPFGSHGVAIRWVNDTTALAVFRNPEKANEALQNTRNSHFKVEHLTDDSALIGLVDERDLQPPVPRPATSSQAAHRMIMGALQRQGLHKKVLPKSTYESSQKQESERKQRLLTRQKLRDEAWG